MRKFILIDGNAILHRAYHAYPPLTNTKGEVVNAVYGFFTMLFLILREQKPDYIAVCFDRSKPTIRQAMYAGYHEHRPVPSDDFIFQIILVHELLTIMRVAIFELEGYEGDDLIGTIATLAIEGAKAQGDIGAKAQKRKGEKEKGNEGAKVQQRIGEREKGNEGAKAQERKGEKEIEGVEMENGKEGTISPLHSFASAPDIEVVIVTGDRDLLQLVNGQVKVLMPIVGITKTVLFDEKAVEEKYGVHPKQFVDYKALIGDASDGYPGVTGIGPKTASKLIQEWGTFENLYKHVGELPEKIGLKLATDAEQAALAKKLAAIITDAPIQFDLQKCACADFDHDSLRKAFEEQGFQSLIKRLDERLLQEDDNNQTIEDKPVKQGKKKKTNANGQLGLLDD